MRVNKKKRKQNCCDIKDDTYVLVVYCMQRKKEKKNTKKKGKKDTFNLACVTSLSPSVNSNDLFSGNLSATTIDHGQFSQGTSPIFD